MQERKQTWVVFSRDVKASESVRDTYTNIKNNIFEELVTSLLPLLEKHTRQGHASIVDHSVDLSIPD